MSSSYKAGFKDGLELIVTSVSRGAEDYFGVSEKFVKSFSKRDGNYYFGLASAAGLYVASSLSLAYVLARAGIEYFK